MSIFNKNRLYTYSIDDTDNNEFVIIQHKNKYNVDELYNICMSILDDLGSDYYIEDVLIELAKKGFIVPQIECAFGIRD